jgi:hypothetical protein
VGDPNADGIVQTQSPVGGFLARPNSTVVLTVGRYVPSGTTTETTTTTTTATTPTP